MTLEWHPLPWHIELLGNVLISLPSIDLINSRQKILDDLKRPRLGYRLLHDFYG